MKQILSNANISVEDTELGYGYDTRTRTRVDLLKAGIVNPTNVELNAIRNAISVAATALSAPTVITLPQDDKTPL
jgi:chaperonin GroEL